MYKLSALVLSLALLIPIGAHANPMRYVPQSMSASATTSPTYMTPGTATTTVSIDAYANGQTAAFDRAVVLTQFTASSTSSTLNINVEYSMDGVDWYQNSHYVLENFVSTTTTGFSNRFDIAPVISAKWTFASSTPGLGAVPTDNNINSKILNIPVIARYTRIIYAMAIGGTNGAVWSSIIPIRQSN